MGKPATTHRPNIHGHDMYLLSRGMLRLVGIAVRSSKNRHYLGPDHVGSNHARQIQGEHCHKKTKVRAIYKHQGCCLKSCYAFTCSLKELIHGILRYFASWLESSSLDRAVRVRALVGDRLLSQCLSLPRCAEFNAGGEPAMD